MLIITRCKKICNAKSKNFIKISDLFIKLIYLIAIYQCVYYNKTKKLEERLCQSFIFPMNPPY